MFYVHYIHLQNWPVLCTTYKYMIKQMHRGYLQESNNSLYTSKNEKLKYIKKKGWGGGRHCLECKMTITHRCTARHLQVLRCWHGKVLTVGL